MLHKQADSSAPLAVFKVGLIARLNLEGWV